MSFSDTRILDANLSWFGYSVLQAMENAGRGVAIEIAKRVSRDKKIAFFCGPGNKGGDGYVAARHLAKTHHASVFVVGEPKAEEAKKNHDLLKKIGAIEVKKIAGPQDFPKSEYDVYVDSLLGTGFEGELREPYASLGKWLNQQKGFKVAVDVPTGFGSSLFFIDDLTISMHKAKKPGAVVIDIGVPKELETFIGPGHVKALRLNKGQHKGQNGVLTVIGGSKKYHGAPLYAIEAAAPFVDLIYFYSPHKENLELKKKSKAFITVEEKELVKIVEKSDVVLAGNGLEENNKNKKLVNALLKKFPDKKFVLDAGGMMLADKKLFKGRVVLTPHAGEFERCFSADASGGEARRQAKKHACIILLKGAVDYVTDGQQVFQNFTGNTGMTRGGTGDVLAGLLAGLATQNDLFLAAQAASFLNGLAGDLVALEKKVFTVEDVARALPASYAFAMKA